MTESHNISQLTTDIPPSEEALVDEQEIDRFMGANDSGFEPSPEETPDHNPDPENFFSIRSRRSHRTGTNSRRDASLEKSARPRWSYPN